MNLESRVKLAAVIREACKREGGMRAYARKIGSSLGAVQGWLECRTIPSTPHLIEIAAEEGYSLEELLELLDASPTSNRQPSDSEVTLRLMRGLPKEELAKVIEAGVRLLLTST